MQKFYVYILRCSDLSLRVGITNDLKLPINQIAKNHFKSITLPDEIIWHKEFPNSNQASLLEQQIKKWSRAKKQALADGNFELLQTLAECRNATHHKYNPNPSTALGATIQKNEQ